MRTLTQMMLLATLGLGVLTLQSCEREGPMEEAGEEIDRAARNAADSIEDACEDVTNSNC